MRNGNDGKGDSPLLDKTQLGNVLGCSKAKLDGLIHSGMPFVWLGAHKRFLLVDVIAWLKSQTESRRGRQ